MIKYPKTPHLPFSPGFDPDDEMLHDVSHFIGKEIVVTTKMDGENASLYCDGYHVRSLDSRHHISRSWLKALHATIKDQIPQQWRVCGENLFACHSLHYTALPSYFLVFSIWNEENISLSWDETKEWAALLDLITVPELYRGLWDEEAVKVCYTGKSFGAAQEGYVVRLAGAFHYNDFSKSVSKWVRKNHVTTSANWMTQPVVANKLASDCATHLPK